MNIRNIYWVIAGATNLFTSVLHTVGGQIDLINPLLKSNLGNQAKTELLGVWHMVTILLFSTSFLLLYFGFKRKENPNVELLSFVSFLYVLFGLGFILVSLYHRIFAPQWVLLFPIGILGLTGIKKSRYGS